MATDEHLPYTDPHIHHHISNSRKDGQDLGTFLQQNEGDPAIQVHPFCSSIPAKIPFLFQDFYRQLHDHLLSRLQGHELMGMKGITLLLNTTLSG